MPQKVDLRQAKLALGRVDGEASLGQTEEDCTEMLEVEIVVGACNENIIEVISRVMTSEATTSLQS